MWSDYWTEGMKALGEGYMKEISLIGPKLVK
jgi:hypothetical protein